MNRPSRSTPLRRRASAYFFVIGITLIVTVLGMGALTLSRVTARATTDGNDWETAGTLAYSAVEHAISSLNPVAASSPTTWRANYTSGQTAFTQTVGRGTFSWVVKDEINGNLSADYLRAFRIYGIGTVGNVTRVYSVQVSPGGSPLDVLRTALHSSSGVELTGKAMNNYGPISSNGQVKLSGTVYGSIEAASTSGSAGGTQSITAPAPAKTMPSASVFDALAGDATTIDYDDLSGGKIDKTLLSPAVNPYGAVNAKGLYLVTLPSGKKLKITNCRIVGTLLVKCSSGGSIDVTGPVLWQPGPTRAPILVASMPGGDVKISGSDTWLSESSAGVNLNPASTPFEGVSNAVATDDFPPQFRGIIHCILGSSGTLELAANYYGSGTVISDCPVKTTAMATLLQDSSIYASPPMGYAVGDALTLVPGTWRWDTLP